MKTSRSLVYWLCSFFVIFCILFFLSSLFRFLKKEEIDFMHLFWFSLVPSVFCTPVVVLSPKWFGKHSGKGEDASK